MRNLVLYIAMSLDGYIADRGGGVGWLAGQDDDSSDMGSYPEFIKTVDTVLMGYTTYHQIATELFAGKWPYEGMQTYVLTHRSLENQPEITFTSEPAAELAKRLRAQSGKQIWICGGANLARQFVESDLVDRYHITVIPTLLGGGIRLFDEGFSEIKLTVHGVSSKNGLTDLIYERRQEPDSK